MSKFWQTFDFRRASLACHGSSFPRRAGNACQSFVPLGPGPTGIRHEKGCLRTMSHLAYTQ